MPKLERLLELARMTRNHRVQNVREMSRACGVSQRTIYRYLNTLSAVDVPRVLQNGNGHQGAVEPDVSLDADDRCLIRHLLDHNQLIHESFFETRLDRLRRLLAPSPNASGRRIRGRVLEVSLSRSVRRRATGDGKLKAFARACLRGQNLSVDTRSGKGVGAVLQPEVVRLADESIELKFRNPATGRTLRLSLDDIVSLRTLPEGGRHQRRAGSTGKKG